MNNKFKKISLFYAIKPESLWCVIGVGIKIWNNEI